MAGYYLGIDIGGTNIKYGLFSEDGALIHKQESRTDSSDNGAHVITDIKETVEAIAVKRGIEKSEIVAAGLGIPGPVTEDGLVLVCPNLGWRRLAAAKEFELLTGIKAVAANDANVAALGEYWQGAGNGVQSMVMVTLGTGVGGGIIINGRIVTGCNGAGGEIGHMTVRLDETKQCGCGGYGHLEQYASATGLVRMMKEKVGDCENSATAKAVFDAAKAGDKAACEVTERFGEYLGMAIANVIQTIEPEAVIIGGGVSKAGEIVIDLVKKYANRFIMPSIGKVQIRLARLGNDAGIYGCAKLAMQKEY